MSVNLKRVFVPILQWGKRENQNQHTEKDLVALPLTHQELTVVMRGLVVARESERTNPADKRTIGLITDRIVRFAERQGACWDVEGELVATVVRTIAARDAAKIGGRCLPLVSMSAEVSLLDPLKRPSGKRDGHANRIDEAVGQDADPHCAALRFELIGSPTCLSTICIPTGTLGSPAFGSDQA